MKSIVALMLVCFAMSAAPVAGQETNTAAVPPQSAKPQAMMQKLAPLAGKWRMTTNVTSDNGSTWQPVAEETVVFELRHKGMLLAEKPMSISADGFNMETYLTFDQYRGVYRKVAIDDSWGVMDTYEGKFEGSQLILTNLKSGTSFPVGNDKWRFFRLNIELPSGDRRSMLIEASDDGGKTWLPAFKVVYIKA